MGNLNWGIIAFAFSHACIHVSAYLCDDAETQCVHLCPIPFEEDVSDFFLTFWSTHMCRGGERKI